MKIILFFVLIIACVYGRTTISFTRNVSLQGDTESWKYRRSSLGAWDNDPFDGDGAWFNSISSGGTKYSAKGDAMWGEASIQTSYPPTAWLAYAEWGIYNTSNEMDVSGARGYVSNAYLALEETAPNGTVVRRQSLKEAVSNSALHWDTSDKGINGELKYVAFSGSVAGEPWKIELTFIVTDVVGVIDLADAVVTPKSLESIVSIVNWPYKDEANSLTLTMAVATGQTRVHGSALLSGSDSSQVYFSLSSKAIVGGSTKDVSVSSFTTVDFSSTFEDNDYKLQLQAVYGSKSECKLVKVTFPAGAADILYDPTIGAGAVPADSQETNSSPTLSLSMLLVLCVSAVVMMLM